MGKVRSSSEEAVSSPALKPKESALESAFPHFPSDLVGIREDRNAPWGVSTGRAGTARERASC